MNFYKNLEKFNLIFFYLTCSGKKVYLKGYSSHGLVWVLEVLYLQTLYMCVYIWAD